MKILKSFVWMLAMTAAIAVSSCGGSDSAGGKVERFVSDNVDIVLTGDIHRFIEATGSTVENGAVKPSSALEDIISTLGGRASNKIDEFLSFKGIDWSNGMLAMKMKGDQPDAIFVWGVTDEKEFAKAFMDQVDADLDIRDQDGYITVGDDNAAIVLKDNMGMFVLKGGEPLKASRAISAIESWEQAAKENPLAGWKTEKLAAEHIVNVLVDAKFVKKFLENESYEFRALRAQFPDAEKNLKKLMNSVMTGYFDIEGKTASAEINLYDQDGNDLKVYEGGKIDTDMLKYGHSDDVFVAAVGDTKSMVDLIKKNLPEMPAEQQQMFSTLIGNLQGTAVFMAGPTSSDINSWDDVSGWNFTAAVSYKDNASAGKALDMLADVAAMEDLRVDGHNAGKALVVKTVKKDYSDATFNYDTYEYEGIREIEIPFYLKVDGKNLVVCNANVQGKGSPVNAELLKDGISAMAFDCRKGGKLLGAINSPFGAQGNVVAAASSVKASITLTDTEDNFLEAIIKLIGSNL